jgi:GT2 family glycosyltransferase
MDLSIIIVNYRSWNKLIECLDTLALNSNKKFISEVIIIDNNSDDGVFESFIDNYPGFRFIRNDINGGFGYGCNRGAREASGRYLLFLNPDTVAEEGAVTALLEKAIANRGDFILSCRQKDEDGGESIAYGQFIAPGRLTGPGRALNRLIRRVFIFHKGTVDQDPLRPDWVSGSVIMTGREFFDRIGGFDEDFWMYYEDMDLCKRVRNSGAEILFYTDFSIRHKHGGSSRVNTYTTALTKTEVLISRHLFVSKHFRSGSRLFSQILLVTGNLIAGLAGAVVGVIFFFEPGIYVRTHIFFRLAGYYTGALVRRSWISPRSVNNVQRSQNTK